MKEIELPSQKAIDDFTNFCKSVRDASHRNELQSWRGRILPVISRKKLFEQYNQPIEYDEMDQNYFKIRNQFNQLGLDGEKCALLYLAKLIQIDEKLYMSLYLPEILGCQPLKNPNIIVDILNDLFPSIQEINKLAFLEEQNHQGIKGSELTDNLVKSFLPEDQNLESAIEEIDQDQRRLISPILKLQIGQEPSHDDPELDVLAKKYDHLKRVASHNILEHLLQASFLNNTPEIGRIVQKYVDFFVNEYKSQGINAQPYLAKKLNWVLNNGDAGVTGNFGEDWFMILVAKHIMLNSEWRKDIPYLASRTPGMINVFGERDELPSSIVTEIVNALNDYINHMFDTKNFDALNFIPVLGQITSSNAFLYCLSKENKLDEQLKWHIIRYARPDNGVTRTEMIKILQRIPENYLKIICILAPSFSDVIAETLKKPELADFSKWLNVNTTIETPILSIQEKITIIPPSPDDVEIIKNLKEKFKQDELMAIMNEVKSLKITSFHIRRRQKEIEGRFFYAQAIWGWNEDKIKELYEKDDPRGLTAIGMIPIKDKEDILNRYINLKKKYQEASNYGIQRQNTLRVAIQYALDALGKLAGYPFYLKFEWNMEAELLRKRGGHIDKLGFNEKDYRINLEYIKSEPKIIVYRNSQQLKTVPDALRKDWRYLALKHAKETFQEQSQRFKVGLETCMIDQIPLSSDELSILMQSLPGKHQLENLYIWIKSIAIDKFFRLIGMEFVYENIKIPISEIKEFYIAHPISMLKANKIKLLQAEIIKNNIVQPFKQVFREMYIIDENKIKNKTDYIHFSGCEINGSIASKLLQSKNYVQKYYYPAHKLWRNSGITSYISFVDDFNYFSQSDYRIIVSSIFFTKKEKDWPLDEDKLPISKVDPILFSETNRVADLITSVANYKKDRIISDSTINLRRSLFNNLYISDKKVEVNEDSIIVHGKLYVYLIDLITSIISILPDKKECCTIQKDLLNKKRKTVYLPFDEDDRKIREIATKIMILKNDEKVKDQLTIGPLEKNDNSNINN